MFAQPALTTSAISVEPAYIDVWQDEEFTVNITVDPAENEVYSASYTLHFDNTLLKAISWTQGEFLTRDGKSSNLWVYEIDNTLGKFEYGEGRISTDVGVGGDPGNLTMITFQPRKTGLCSFNISDLDSGLLYSTSGPIIPTDINNGSVEIVVPSTPFLIYGYVSYENGNDCNDPAVNITNMDIGVEWTAETSETSNYYQIALSSCADVIAGEVLQFNTISPDGPRSNATDHNATHGMVHDGGLFGFNITLNLRCGDVDCNGVINILDVRLLSNHVSNGYPINEWTGDVNCDNRINGTDVQLLLTYMFSGHPLKLECCCG
jgi:hypothetical protein